MRLKILFLFFISFGELFGDVVPHDKDYYEKNVGNTNLIYTKQNAKFAAQTAGVEGLLHNVYEQQFAYEMDESLYVGLASEFNQLSNGFSSQYPNNRQINYMGGALQVDYFSSTSWLNMLLYHETAHNYQMNVKENSVSKSLHSVFGNGSVIFPFITLPNILESSFLAEGNSVLNESWHGNGGRLYSGRFYAATLMQAKAGYLTAERVFNDNLFFLYGSHHYTLGGFYHYYLAQKYGLEKVNSYWKKHSKYWYWPFVTNKPMKKSIGVNFEDSLNDWAKEMKKESENLVETSGEIIAKSQFYTPLNDDANSIYFITNETAREHSSLVTLNKNDKSVNKEKSSWLAGKVVKTPDGIYTTQASAHTSPWRIYQGLYDNEAFVIEDTQGKIVEGYLKSGDTVYFDVKTSFDQPQLYVGDSFYDQVNSSVYINNNDIYYFKQNGKTRTLYKNKKALFSIQGYYSAVKGVDSEGAIYFIANSKYGSSLYKYNYGEFKRVSSADTIIDAKLIDEKSALVVAIGSDNFTYEIIELQESDAKPYEVKLFFEDYELYREADAEFKKITYPEMDFHHEYHSLFSMKNAGVNFSFSQSENSDFMYNFRLSFADPLSQNALSFLLFKDADDYTLTGIGYSNSQYFIDYELFVLGVLERGEVPTYRDERDYGIIAQADIDLYRRGHYQVSVSGAYFQDYQSATREPLSFALNFNRFEQFGVSMYPNMQISFSPYFSHDRGDKAYGFSGKFSKDLGMETYFGFGAQHSSSDATLSYVDQRGIKVVKSTSQSMSESDPTTVAMPSLRRNLYLKEITKGSFELTKVLNYSKYFFVFPASLRREAFYAKLNHYTLEDSFFSVKTKEVILGIKFDTFLFNNAEIPISLEYIYNENDYFAHKESIRFQVGYQF